MSSKLLLLGIFFLMAAGAVVHLPDYPVSVMQINARWNEENSLCLDSLTRCNVYTEYLEDQTKSVKENLPPIPIIVVYWEDEAVATYSGDISLRNPLTLDSLQGIIDNLYLYAEN